MTQQEAKTIQEIAQTSPTAKYVLGMWSLKQRNRSEPLDLTRFKLRMRRLGFPCNEKDFEFMLSMLEAYKHGQVLKGYRFKANKNLQILGQSAKVERPIINEIVDRVSKEAPKPVVVEVPKLLANSPRVQKTIVILVINGGQFKLELPGNVSEQQLDQITRVLTTS